MAMNTGTFPSALEEGLNTVFGLEYRRWPEQWKAAFEIRTSKKNKEEDVMIVDLGNASAIAESADIPIDEGGEAWTALYVHRNVGLGFEYSIQQEQDNLYMKVARSYASSVARSMINFKNQAGAAVFNNAFDAGYTGGDGKPLLATDHPLWGGGTASNKLAVDADLSEDSLRDLLIQINTTVDDRGKPIMLMETKMHLPPQLKFVAEVVLNSVHRPGTQVNDVNPINSLGIFGSPPNINHYFSDPEAWFVQTNAPNGLIHYNRMSPDSFTYIDPRSRARGYNVLERYSFGWTDWRNMFGSR